jgi:virginiamycin B lyase
MHDDKHHRMTFTRRSLLAGLAAAVALPAAHAAIEGAPLRLQSWPLKTPQRTGIHDVAPAPDGGVWFTAQASGHLGWFTPATGAVALVPLGPRSSPHGVVPGPDGAAWIADGGQQAIVRVDAKSREVKRFPLPEATPYANLNTGTFDGEGIYWFTGQSGVLGRLDPRTGALQVNDAPKGRGPYGICTTPQGDVWWCSLAGSFIAHIDRKSGASRVVEPPTRGQGARRVWSDSRGRIWVSEWNSGQLSVHDPAARTPAQAWRQWKLPGREPHAYAVYVDERDHVWVSDFGGNTVWRFDPAAERFDPVPFPREAANVRQIHGRKGEVWLPESGTEHLSMVASAA